MKPSPKKNEMFKYEIKKKLQTKNPKFKIEIKIIKVKIKIKNKLKGNNKFLPWDLNGKE